MASTAPVKISAMPTEADKADRVKLWSFARPHYLNFHLAWLAFFVVRAHAGRVKGCRRCVCGCRWKA